jgi:hypothetical protein
MAKNSRARPKYDPSKADFDPIQIDTIENHDPVEPIHLFTIDGTQYFMPGFISPALALRALEVVELRGQEAGISYMLHEVLGDEAHTALKECESIRPSQLRAIMDIVTNRVLGALEEAREGNSGGG